MAIEHKDLFYTTRLEEERAKDKRVTFTISLNEDEQAKLEEVMNILQEEQKGKALKQCFQIGYDVLHEPKMVSLREAVFKNTVNNGRKGIVVIDGKIRRL